MRYYAKICFNLSMATRSQFLGVTTSWPMLVPAWLTSETPTSLKWSVLLLQNLHRYYCNNFYFPFKLRQSWQAHFNNVCITVSGIHVTSFSSISYFSNSEIYLKNVFEIDTSILWQLYFYKCRFSTIIIKLAFVRMKMTVADSYVPNGGKYEYLASVYISQKLCVNKLKGQTNKCWNLY